MARSAPRPRPGEAARSSERPAPAPAVLAALAAALLSSSFFPSASAYSLSEMSAHVPIGVTFPRPKPGGGVGRGLPPIPEVPAQLRALGAGPRTVRTGRFLLEGEGGGEEGGEDAPEEDDAWQVPAPAPAFLPATEADEAVLAQTRVRMCMLNWERYREDPAATPMYKDVLLMSGCVGEAASAESVKVVPFLELEQEYMARGCGDPASGPAPPSARGCSPSGVVFHESRCGSTLVTNMLAVLPGSVTYSESAPPHDILSEPDLSEAVRVRVLRVVMAAMGRPIALNSVGRRIPLAGPEWSPSKLLFKFQSSPTLHMGTVRRAFPATPWTFIHRDGVEVMASLFRGAARVPAPDAPLSAHVSGDDQFVRRAPCMRQRDTGPPKPLLGVTGTVSTSEAYALPPEEYCAASVSLLVAAALTHATAARKTGLARAGLYPEDDPEFDPADGASVAGLAARSGGAVVAVGGYLLDGETGRGTVGGVGQGIFLDYTSLPDAAVGLAQSHFGFALEDEDVDRMLAVSAKYSKARASGGVGVEGGGEEVVALRGPRNAGRPHPSSMDKAGRYIDDREEKQEKAWPSLRAATHRYLSGLRTAVLAFNTPIVGGSGPSGTTGGGGGDESAAAAAPLPPRDLTALLEAFMAPAAGDAEEADAAAPASAAPPVPGQLAAAADGLFGPDDAAPLEVGYDPVAHGHVLPLGEGYPMLFPLASLLGEWTSDITTPPPTYGRYSSLRVFDWLTEREEAERYRRAEVPFVIRNVPSLDRAAAHFSDDATLLGMMGESTKYMAEVNDNNHFMYYNKLKAKKRSAVAAEYKAPTREEHIAAGSWLRSAKEVATAVADEEARGLPSWWFADPEGPEAAARVGVSSTVDAPERAKRTLAYMRASTDPRDKQANRWIYGELPLFDKDGARSGLGPDATRDETSFFLMDASQQRGIHCRFGMPGIIAEAHYDGGRNFITMQRGRKRYILAPPSECGNLHLLRDGPSSRHSEIDWSDPAHIPRLSKALALEIIIEAGDALYVPAFWFHYITSLDVNIQCNTRSGTPTLYKDELAKCGFGVSTSEEIGAFTSPDAAELQPSREKHMEIWRRHWPTVASLDAGLGRGVAEGADGAGAGGGDGEEGEGAKTAARATALRGGAGVVKAAGRAAARVAGVRALPASKILRAFSDADPAGGSYILDFATPAAPGSSSSRLTAAVPAEVSEQAAGEASVAAADRAGAAPGSAPAPAEGSGEAASAPESAPAAAPAPAAAAPAAAAAPPAAAPAAAVPPRSSTTTTGAATKPETGRKGAKTLVQQRAAEAIAAAAEWAIGRKRNAAARMGSGEAAAAAAGAPGKGSSAIKRGGGGGGGAGGSSSSSPSGSAAWVSTLKTVVSYAFFGALLVVCVQAVRWWRRIEAGTGKVGAVGLEGRQGRGRG
jgi:hypothetical protein